MGAINRGLAFVILGALSIFLIAAPVEMIAFSGGAIPPIWEAPAIVAAVVIVAALIAFRAPTARHAWGRLLLINGLACFALPFMGIVFTAVVGSHVAHTIQSAGGDSGATVLGTAAAGVALTGVLGFLGFFLGIILVIAAYFVLRGAARPLRIEAIPQ